MLLLPPFPLKRSRIVGNDKNKKEASASFFCAEMSYYPLENIFYMHYFL